MGERRAREIAEKTLRGELHPLDACSQIALIWKEAGYPESLAEFGRLADIYEFHLDQPSTIRKILELSEELCSDLSD